MMLPNKVIYTKKIIYKLHNEIGFMKQFNCDQRSLANSEINSLIEWLETELFQQSTRAKEADIGFLLREILRGITLIELENHNHSTLCNEVTLYLYLERIMHREYNCQTKPITSEIVNRLTTFFKESLSCF